MDKTEKMGFGKGRRFIVDWHNQPQNISLGGRSFHFKSKFESVWGRYLQQLYDLGVIEAWGYETKTFIFKGETRGLVQYTPDFYVKQDSEECYQETKVHLIGKDITKYRRMAKHYPNVKLVLVMDRPRNKEFSRLRMAKKYVYRLIYANQTWKK